MWGLTNPTILGLIPVQGQGVDNLCIISLPSFDHIQTIENIIPSNASSICKHRGSRTISLPGPKIRKIKRPRLSGMGGWKWFLDVLWGQWTGEYPINPPDTTRKYILPADTMTATCMAVQMPRVLFNVSCSYILYVFYNPEVKKGALHSIISVKLYYYMGRFTFFHRVSCFHIQIDERK